MQANLHPESQEVALKLPPDATARYEIVRVLGRGAQGTTYLARERQSGASVAVKVLALPDVATWKDIELFEREVAVLRQLDHPRIPRYLDSVLDHDGGILVLVREYVESEPLSAILDREETLSAEEARELLLQVLEVLEYLHTLLPPVVHRDIKPQNVIRRPDGSYVLIDFGAVSAATMLTGGSTFVGTNGYMPAEQLMGRADSRSDLYALGATTIQMLSGHHPQNLVGEAMRMRLDVLPEGAAALQPVLARMVEPLPEQRFQSAKHASVALADDSPLALAAEQHANIRTVQSGNGLQIVLPAVTPSISYGIPLVLAYFLPFFLPVAGLVYVTGSFLLAFLFGLLARTTYSRVVTLTPDELQYTQRFAFFPGRTRRLHRSTLLGVDRATGGKLNRRILVQPKSGRRWSVGIGAENSDLDWVVQRIRYWMDEEQQ